MLECGFYYSLLIASIWDGNKSDFWEMTIHHCVTIGLLSASWTVNYVRYHLRLPFLGRIFDILLLDDIFVVTTFGSIYRKCYHFRVGTLVLLSHDTADVFLEFSKFVRLDFNNNFVTNISTITFLIV